MARLLQHVVVLGAGTMGARLAAHCANHGLQVNLLDQTRDLAAAGLKAAAASRPASFFLPELAANVRVGDFDDKSLSTADWIVEAVVEDLDAKRALLGRVAPCLPPNAVFTTNTSGLPVHEVGAKLPAGLRPRWFGTHFFNPPRYMRLVEMIPTADTDPEAVTWLQEVLEGRLGKGAVAARDTPNFIANRIGVYALLNTLQRMQEYRLGVEEVDALTGPLLGWPKSATFRTLDMIGIDTLIKVVENSYRNLPQDEQRELFHVPEFLQAMLERGWLGDKTGQGFYKRNNNDILALDLNSFTYHPRRKVTLPFEDLHSALRVSPFVRDCVEGVVAYSRNRLGEITDDPEAINCAMRWGYNWQHGPFELEALVKSGQAAVRPVGRVVRSNPCCSLIELSEGVGCLEFHTKLNVIGADTVAMVTQTLADTHPSFDAFVISNGAENFSVGADLLYLLAIIQNEDWDEVDMAVRAFQNMTMAVKRSPRPVVVAPFGMALGGGCELTLHAAQVVAHAELYTGLVEVGVGLIPAGGGTKEMALRMDAKTAFETIALAKVSTSAAEAGQLRYLRRGSEIVANRDRLLEAARQCVRQIANAGYEPPLEQSHTAPGPSVQSTLELGVYLMKEAGRISDHDQTIAKRLIHVICAGGAPTGMIIPESRLLDLEREAFLSLCGEPKTQERVSYMLKTGKPLRN